jgi:hypothetical protein
MRQLWILPEIWETTLRLMQPYATRGVEAGCFWYGMRTDTAAFAVTAGIPAQINRPRNFEIPSEALAELIAHLPTPDLAAVAQIHTHPGDDTEHSPWDDDLVVSRKIYSLVLPMYGRLPCPLESAGVHLFADGEWRQLDSADAAIRVRVLPAIVDTRQWP